MLHKIEPRFMLKTDAARYCGMNAMQFGRLCPVPAVRLADKMLRWDRQALDRWMDGLTKTTENMTEDEWLGKLRDDAAARRVRRSRQGR